MKINLRHFTCLFVCLILSASIAQGDAFQDPNMSKQSYRHLEWNLGVSAGGSFFATEHDTGVFYEEGDYSQEREGFITGSLNVGYGVAANMVFGVEGGFWPGSFDGENGEERWSVLFLAAKLKFYPGTSSLCIDVAAGFAFAKGEMEPTISAPVPLTDEVSKTAPAIRIGAGWEWRVPLEDKIITIGPSVGYNYILMGDDLTANAITFGVTFQWYSNNRETNRYFHENRG
ncbi:MAG: outer membrane beta-barrel protein [bacterium]|nr:outer membrane beta-barrel protein [bacterium]